MRVESVTLRTCLSKWVCLPCNVVIVDPPHSRRCVRVLRIGREEDKQCGSSLLTLDDATRLWPPLLQHLHHSVSQLTFDKATFEFIDVAKQHSEVVAAVVAVVV